MTTPTTMRATHSTNDAVIVGGGFSGLEKPLQRADARALTLERARSRDFRGSGERLAAL
jgi:hypothetical protein